MMIRILSQIIFFICFFNLYTQEVDYSAFKGKDVKLNHSSKVIRPHILNYNYYPSKGIDSIAYKPNLLGQSENVLYNKYKQDLEANSNSKILLEYKFTYGSEANFTSIIKFRVLSLNESESKILILKKVDGEWKEIKKSKYSSFEIIMKNLDIEIFWQFYNSSDNPNYPEINKLKPLVKDASGVLNIEKLAQVIEENKAKLNKYLD
ncbi:hypothetical protein NBT05_12845 [Aquimarina sp. ERC-38]|uniref:hypothetical protein n=1 Tax=Aquimarina sp. ERC-38 TaxID=2949996 RepID=UPI0022466084|nr:hypothetical protein [Aquimarina sp. ERC-38]UZO79837.1 hypothetical protein NBT05_12845 [Aquimarina sp. ERC-38]